MHGAEVLPFGRAHFGACLRRAGRVLGEEGNKEVVDFHGEKTAQFVEPEGSVDALGRFGQLDCDLAGDRDYRV